ncbi:DUF4025 domain-containing protein [Brevibacillus sp. SAFN-007a]|uniref:DUF4025 domain-containing protein n=1 Tax=Brevibacillus sp. SAFN-007a TaxID=3436862 RepID=UPI003F800523
MTERDSRPTQPIGETGQREAAWKQGDEEASGLTATQEQVSDMYKTGTVEDGEKHE